MFLFLCVAFSVFCSTQAGFSKKIKDLHLHAKLGEGLPENPPTSHFELVDQYVSQIAEKFVKTHIIQETHQFKAMYGPIENVVLPGVKLTRPINLKNIVINGLRRLQLKGLQWRLESNELWCNATLPSLLVVVTFDKVQIELDQYLGGGEFVTSIRLSVRLLDLEINASARYNVNVMPIKSNVFIDKAEVDFNVRDVLFEIEVQQGLEEVRYVLTELMNNSLEDIMDAVLKVVVQEINKELLGKVDPNYVTDYLNAKLPGYSKVPQELIAIHSI